MTSMLVCCASIPDAAVYRASSTYVTLPTWLTALSSVSSMARMTFWPASYVRMFTIRSTISSTEFTLAFSR